jgi:uncharacterized membrane protein
MFLAPLGGLVIDWTQMPTYNTIMSVAAGAALIMLVYFAREIIKGGDVIPDAWAIGFAVPGSILTATGIHMTLTWPMAKYFPFDNIIFGETSLAFGVLLLAAAVYLWKRGGSILESGDAARYLARLSQPVSVFIFGMGLGLFAIAAAGIVYQLFAAPPEEPLTGAFAAYPWVEATFMSAMFGVVGLGAVLFPFAVRSAAGGTLSAGLNQIIGWAWTLTGLGFLLFGALNFFTHIGLIVNTMGTQ